MSCLVEIVVFMTGGQPPAGSWMPPRSVPPPVPGMWTGRPPPVHMFPPHGPQPVMYRPPDVSTFPPRHPADIRHVNPIIINPNEGMYC